MLLNLLTATEDPTRAPENLGEPALYALLGFLVVFVGIAFLIFVVWLVGKILYRSKDEKVTTVKEKAPELPAAPQSNDTEEISEETVAVITAALMAYYQQVGGPKCEFRVRRIKRI